MLKCGNTQTISITVPNFVVLDYFGDDPERSAIAERFVNKSVRRAMAGRYIELTLDDGEIFKKKE